jgi:hypothetical protein
MVRHVRTFFERWHLQASHNLLGTKLRKKKGQNNQQPAALIFAAFDNPDRAPFEFLIIY